MDTLRKLVRVSLVKSMRQKNVLFELSHEEAEGILRAIIVDDGIVNNDRSSLRDGVIGFSKEQLFFFQAPVMENVPHHDHIGRGAANR